MAGREGTPRSSFRTIAVLTVLPILGLFAFVVFRAIYPKAQHVAKRIQPVLKREEPPKVREAAEGRGPKTAPAIAKQETAPSIVLIIDDLGFDGQQLERVMALDPDINLAILPNGSRAAEFSERLDRRGFEILCHLPMEPIGSESPGRNAIFTAMTSGEIADLVRSNLRAVPHARGVNNHMGSRATADRRVMSSVISALPRHMYFLDSRTGGSSVAASVAREMNVRTATRDVFLDDERTHAAVRRQLAVLATLARERGTAIGIGHPYPVTLDVLAEEIPRLKERGFRFIRASAVVD